MAVIGSRGGSRSSHSACDPSVGGMKPLGPSAASELYRTGMYVPVLRRNPAHSLRPPVYWCGTGAGRDAFSGTHPHRACFRGNQAPSGSKTPRLPSPGWR